MAIPDVALGFGVGIVIGVALGVAQQINFYFRPRMDNTRVQYMDIRGERHVIVKCPKCHEEKVVPVKSVWIFDSEFFYPARDIDCKCEDKK
jgi:hypothetical protein